MFEETARYYEQYLSNWGYKEKLNYRDPTPPILITKSKRQKNLSKRNLKIDSQNENW